MRERARHSGPHPGVCRDAGQVLRERVRARPHLPLRQGAVHLAGDLHGRHGARDQHDRDHGPHRGDEQAGEVRGGRH